MLAKTGSRATKTTWPLGDQVARQVAREPVFRTGLSPVMVGRAAGLAALRDQAART
jgi:hypothetical protein